MRIAVVGATGTAGSRTVTRLKRRGIRPVEVTRSHGADLITGTGLAEALHGVDVVIDTSNPAPPDDTLSLLATLTSAARNLVDACCKQRVRRVVLLSISGIENPALDGFAYYVAKRAQEQILKTSPLASTILRSAQWHEFATNPAAVTFAKQEVSVQDWLIQPVAADTVADVLVDLALDSAAVDMAVAGPEVVRLPDLTARLLRHHGDPRSVRAVPPTVPALGGGALLAPADAAILGPDVATWLGDSTAPGG